MSNYIDPYMSRDDISKYITTWNCNDPVYGKQFVMAVDDLKYLPTVYIEEVRHGHWIKWWEVKSDDAGAVERIPHWKCSECHREYLPHSAQFIKYCPNCGSKFDASDENLGGYNG